VNGNHYPNVELSDGSFSAWGAGGHFIAVIPALNVVVVHRVNARPREEGHAGAVRQTLAPDPRCKEALEVGLPAVYARYPLRTCEPIL
jgi:CubicO group peptidase (beta-lactamase class C family)